MNWFLNNSKTELKNPKIQIQDFRSNNYKSIDYLSKIYLSYKSQKMPARFLYILNCFSHLKIYFSEQEIHKLHPRVL